ncbi:hypothetical protein CEB3_c20610 [Peptococcaceae bacterium CEB3]|nr:hypothetical protein CEB3_c20610 [Peptococcaceae bacterium CEB3]
MQRLHGFSLCYNEFGNLKKALRLFGIQRIIGKTPMLFGRHQQSMKMDVGLYQLSEALERKANFRME